MHNQEGYSAIRANDWLFQSQSAGPPAIEGLTTAFHSATQIAQFEIFNRGAVVNDEHSEDIAKTLPYRRLGKWAPFSAVHP